MVSSKTGQQITVWYFVEHALECIVMSTLTGDDTHLDDTGGNKAPIYPHVCTVHQRRLKHVIIQQMHKYIIR